jgi:hypothetical protein
MRKLVLAAVLVASSAFADPKIAKVTSVKSVQCNTDGGSVTCSMGIKYMGTLVQSWFNQELADKPAACAADVKPGNVTFRFGYEYNDGNMLIYDADKVQAKWPACVKDFAKRVNDKWLEWYKMLQPIDQSIDVRNEYKVTIAIKK